MKSTARTAPFHAGLATAGLLLASFAVAGCSRPDADGPPALRLGRDECAECGMLVGEDRCSCGAIVERDGRREHALFDDIGCMLDSRDDRTNGLRFAAMFVHDHGTKEWIRADAAWFMVTDPGSLRTPMGSGVVAFATRAAAETAAGKHGGRVADYAGLDEARRTIEASAARR